MRRVLLAAGGGGGAFAATAPYPPTDNGWTRDVAVPILRASEAWEGFGEVGAPLGWVQEPSVVNLGDGFLTMFYTGGVSGSGTDYAIGRATCPIASDPKNPASWTKYASNPILGLGAGGYAGKCLRTNVFVGLDGLLHIYFSNNTNILHSTSSDAGFTWATPTTVLLLSSFTGSPTQLTNSHIWQESSSDWRMLVEPVGGTWVDQMAYCTSSNGTSWTIGNGGNPLSDLMPAGLYSAGGPWIIKEGPKRHLWYVSTTDASGLPSANYHAVADISDLTSWTITGGPAPVLYPSGGFEFDQVTDPCLVVVSGTAYHFYAGNNNTTGGSFAGEAGPWFMIGCASAPAVYSMG